MKNFNSILLAAAASIALVFTFTSCDKGDLPAPKYELRIVDFEAAELDENDIQKKESYEEKRLTFVNTYTVDGDYWSGFAFSSMTDKITPGWGNQYSVYDTGGASESKKFAVSCIFGTSEMKFAPDEAYEIEYAWFNNSTYAYLAIKDGNDGLGSVKGPFQADDWFKLTVTGYDEAGTRTQALDIYLADFRDGKSFIMSDWTKVSLTPLGKVNKVTFALSSTDNHPDYGMNTPAYFCLDNVAYRVY